ncbi:MAG: SDR family NAD(P)-dependent oxidoreductase, partial [Pseudomonadota bacterium]
MLLNDKVFRDSFSACSELATDLGVEPLLDLIMSPDLGAKLDRAPVAQPMLLAVQVSLVDALAAQGLHPGAVLGHSAGEVAAAYACGAITRADAIRIIVARSQTLDQLYSQGTMAALACDTKSAENLIETANLDVEVAGENSGSSITVSGTSNDVAQLLKICRSKRIAGRRLQIEYPYHSFLTDPLKSQLLDELEGISGRDTEVSFFSGCLGKQVPGSTLDSNFWWLNARKPVRFKQCVEAMAERGISVFLEISPKSVLQTYVRETLAETGHSGTVLGSLEETDSGKIDAFSITLNALSNGAEVDEDLLLGEKPGNAEQMPVYPFDRKPFRLASETPFDFFGRKKQHALLGGRIDPNADVWTSDLSLGRLPWLADHKVDGSVVLPAAAIVEMFLSAASEIVAAEGVELRHVEILKPIRLTETGVVPIRMTYDAPSRRLTLEQNQSGAWNWVAGAAVFQLGSVEGRGLDLAAGKKATDFYQTLSGMGLEYGPSFARMAHVSVGKSSVDVRLSESQIDQNGLLLDPTGIDACLHAALPLLETLDTSENKIFVPGRFGKLKLFKSGTCVGARLSLVGGDTSGVCFDAIFVDPEGAPLAGVEDMWLRPMPRLKRNEIRYYDERFVPVQPRSSLSGLELPESVFRLEESAPDDLEVLRDAIAGRIAWDIVNSSNDNEFRDRRYQSALLSLEDMGLLEIRDLSPTALTGECPWPDLSSLLELLVDTQPSASDELQATMHAAVSDRRNENAGIDALRDVSLSLVGSLPEKIGRAVILGDVDPAVFKRLLDIAEYVVVALDRPDKADTLRLDLKNSEKSFFTTIDHAATLPNFDLILGLGLASKPPAQHQKSLSSLLKSGSHLLLVDYASDLFETMTGRYTDEISVDVLDGQIAHLCNIVQRRPSRDYSHVRVLSTGLLSRDTAESEASPVVFGQSNFANDLRSDPPALCSSTVAILALDSESDQITSMLLQAENARNLPADSETIWLAQRGQKGADALLGLRRVLANETGRDVRAMLVDNDVPPEKVVSLAASSLERELFVSQDLVSTKRITPAFNSKLSLGPDEKAILRQSNRGRLETLDWSKETRREPGPSEIEISVTATALNFRDVMLAQGLLQSDLLEGGFAGPTLGMELSGTVVRAGNDARFSPGQRVIAFASDAFATHVTVDERAAIAAPDDVDLNIAAALPVIFITAEYALTELARIRADEWVLIHGGAGGVGLAAIQVANRAGARIIATAGSDEKRTLLKSLGVQHVCDSRSLAFSDYVEEVTNGHGVDVLVNSLAGEAMERSIGTLAPFGRFIELGKRDFAANSSIGLRALKDNISYFAVDADKLLKHRPEIVADTMARVIETFDEGEYTAPPTRQFPAEMAEQAFRLMQRSAHVGKILITPPDTEVASETKTLSFAGQWLIAGGTKGFGLSTAKWLADQGATGLWLVSRSGKTDDASLVNGLKTKGVDVQVRAADLTQPDEVDALMDDVANHCGGLNGIVCGTAVFNDAFLDDVSKEDYARVVSAKLGAALELDRASRRFELDHFWLYSSVAARFGNPGQSAYCAANAELEAVARERNEQDLPALAISWGPIGNAGYLERSEDVKSALERKLGGLMSSQSALDALGTALKSGHGSATLTVAQIDWSRLRSDLPVISEPLFEFLSTSGSSEDDENGIDIAALIASIGEAKTRRKVLDILRKEAA